MPTSTFECQTTYIATNALQPTQSGPPDLPIYSDSISESAWEGELQVGNANAVLPITTTWAYVNQLVIINKGTLATNTLMIGIQAALAATPTTYINQQYIWLAPNGGYYATSGLVGTYSSDVAQYTRVSSITLWSPVQYTTVYVWMTGGRVNAGPSTNSHLP